jgi:hypothetical protein
MFLSAFRSRWSVGIALAALITGTGAGAATLHRFAVTSATGSGGATTFLQSTASGSALQGEVAGAPQTAIKIPFGVLGEYNASNSTFGSGVLGISTTGYGIGAESLSASQPSVLALNSSGGPAAQVFGELGGDAVDAEVTGSSSTPSLGAGVYASSDGGNAIEGYTPSGFAAIYAEDDAPNVAGYGLAGESYSPGGTASYALSAQGVGVSADSESGEQGLPSVQAITGTDGTELFDAGVSDTNTSNVLSLSTVLSSVSDNGSGEVITNGAASSDLQLNGDIYITGAIYTNCDGNVPYETSTANCGNETLTRVRSSGGSDYQMYASAHANKTVEDEGEAELRGGVAHVALDPSFASVISTREPYLVFTTPQGDTRGLYVTNRTASGFDVRETQGGRGTLTFDYRIVAHPYGERVARMALATRKLRSHSAGGYPKMSRALKAMLAHMHTRPAARKAHTLKAPPSLVSTASFTR